MSDQGESPAADRSQPVLSGRGASDYERYLRTDELLALQKPPAEQVHRDELLFQTVHQTSELWLKLAGAEVEEATALIDADRLAAATRRAGLGVRHRPTRHARQHEPLGVPPDPGRPRSRQRL